MLEKSAERIYDYANGLQDLSYQNKQDRLELLRWEGKDLNGTGGFSHTEDGVYMERGARESGTDGYN